MNYLFKPTLKNVLARKEVKLFFGFTIFPLLLIIVDLFDTKFMQLGSQTGSLDFVEFFAAMEIALLNMALPIIVLSYLISIVFYQEIQDGLLFLHKDISRIKILHAKMMSLVVVVLLFHLLLFVTSLITYYTHLVHMSYISGHFITVTDGLGQTIIEIVGVISMQLLILLVTVNLSLYTSSGITILGSILFLLVGLMSNALPTLRYFFPIGYISVAADGMSPKIALLIALGIFIVYSGLMYINAHRGFKRLEY